MPDLERRAMKLMESWHNAPNRTALLIDGARQVGKTYLVREFAHTHYQHLVEFNFIEEGIDCHILRIVSIISTLVSVASWLSVTVTDV